MGLLVVLQRGLAGEQRLGLLRLLLRLVLLVQVLRLVLLVQVSRLVLLVLLFLLPGLLRPLPGVLLLLEIAPEASVDHFVHRPYVVLALEGLDLEAAVFALTGEAVLEDHHGRHDVVALEVRDVEALDPQRRAVQVEGLRDLLQRAGAGGEIAGALGLVQDQGLLGVAPDRRHQVLLVATLRNPQGDLGAAALAQPLCDGVRVLRQGGDEHLLGDGVAALLPVQLLKRVLDQARRLHCLDLVGDPAALAADPAAADMEDLYGGLQLVLGDGDQVGVGGVGEHDRVLLHRAAQGAYVVTQ